MSEFQFAKVKTPPLKDRVYDELKVAIMSGKIVRGQKLTARAIAKGLGTSDMPVRAGLNRLLAEGALVQIATSGTMVLPDVTRDDFTEWMELRAVLERRAAERAAPHVKTDALRRLEKACDALSRANQRQDLEAHLDANFKFKHELYSHANSPTLNRFIEMLWLRVGPFLRDPSVIDECSTISEATPHEDVIVAIKAGDSKSAGRSIYNDIQSSKKMLLKEARFWNDG